jgi:Mn-dependent DtxR family transcriptional regulator
VTEGLVMSSAMEDYLETILILYEELKDVRVTDIAESLKVAKASVAQAIQSLKKKWFGDSRKVWFSRINPKRKEHGRKSKISTCDS